MRLSVVQVPSMSCPAHRKLVINSQNTGYLASYITEQTGCGGPVSPWLIRADRGQTIHLTLLGFTAKNYDDDDDDDRHVTTSLCPVYAVITELGHSEMKLGHGRNVSVCGGMLSRERHVFSSLTNQITVSITVNEFKNRPSYLLKFRG